MKAYDIILQENKELKDKLKKAKILIKIQKKLLKNFLLHDDAGTAYVYLGPNPDDIERIIETKEDLSNMSKVDKLEYISDLLYEIDDIENEIDNISKENKNNLELLQNYFMDLYIEEKNKKPL